MCVCVYTYMHVSLSRNAYWYQKWKRSIFTLPYSNKTHTINAFLHSAVKMLYHRACIYKIHKQHLLSCDTLFLTCTQIEEAHEQLHCFKFYSDTLRDWSGERILEKKIIVQAHHQMLWWELSRQIQHNPPDPLTIKHAVLHTLVSSLCSPLSAILSKAFSRTVSDFLWLATLYVGGYVSPSQGNETSGTIV